MIPEKKYCQKCWKLISDINTADYFSHIRIKYCKECAKETDRELAAGRMRAVRRKAKENNKLARELNSKLLQENEMLKRQLEQVRERLEELQ